MRRVFSISAKKFIAAHAGHEHSYVSARFLANQKRGYNRGVGSGLVHMPAQLRQQVGHIWFNDDLPIFASQLCRQASRDRRIVKRILTFAIFLGKRHGVSAKRSLRGPHHCRHNARGIKSRTQECAEWHVADHLLLD